MDCHFMSGDGRTLPDHCYGFTIAAAKQDLERLEPHYRDACSDELLQSADLLDLNVGGCVFRVLRSTFAFFPRTRLARLARAKNEKQALWLCDAYKIDGGSDGIPQYFFNRNWINFNSILDFYRLKSLHITGDVCKVLLKEDLEYWGLNEIYLDPCCALKYFPEIDSCWREFLADRRADREESDRLQDEMFRDSKCGDLRRRLWKITEHPESSWSAKMFYCTSLGVTCLSTLTFILQTFPQFQEPDDEDNLNSSNVDIDHNEFAVGVISFLDKFAMIFFTLEYVLRLCCSPHTWSFVKKPMNLVDLLAILPFYLSLVLENLEDMHIIGKAGKQVRLIRILRIMRIFRIFKLVRHFAGLQSLIYTLNQAYQELGMLMLLVTVTVLTFACLVFYAEKDSDLSGQWNVLDSIWWAILTLTTVGPPHKNPESLLGKVVAGTCALVGIFILTLPIPIIVNSFTSHYKNRMWHTELAVKRAELLDKVARPKNI